ncbi:MAG: hypothetical protein K6D03_10150 [Solobacterium sp.]|nr:hypothetical protein [Solobacterium sp.]
MMLYKRYVDVEVLKKRSGETVPLALYWYNGKPVPDRYEISKILKTEMHSSSRVGGTGKLYVVMIRGQVRNLYLEDKRWFIESLRP